VAIGNTVVLAANANRKGFSILNAGGNKVYIAYGPTCSTSVYAFDLAANGIYQHTMPFYYTGQISAIRPSGSGAVVITEFT
jgi:hypothetical protein